jgi:hypothetical protein
LKDRSLLNQGKKNINDAGPTNQDTIMPILFLSINNSNSIINENNIPKQ